MEAKSILASTQQLDSQVLGLLHDEYYPVVYRYVSYRLEDPQICEDITSEVFLRLLEALRHRRDTIRDVRAWLLGTASHMVSDQLRQKYQRPTDNLDDHDSLPGGDTTEGQVEKSMRQSQVRQAIYHLTEEQQHVLALRFSQDCSLEETAQMMGKTIGAVKVLQFRAIDSLRRLLGER